MTEPATDQMLDDVKDRVEFATMLQMPRASFSVELIAAVVERLEQAETRLAEMAEDAIDFNDARDRASE